MLPDFVDSTGKLCFSKIQRFSLCAWYYVSLLKDIRSYFEYIELMHTLIWHNIDSQVIYRYIFFWKCTLMISVGYHVDMLQFYYNFHLMLYIGWEYYEIFKKKSCE